MADFTSKPADAGQLLAQRIAAEIEAQAEETIREAVARYEKKLREAIGLAAIRAASTYDMRVNQRQLVIRIELDDHRGGRDAGR